jgi:hypothetical protein
MNEDENDITPADVTMMSMQYAGYLHWAAAGPVTGVIEGLYPVLNATYYPRWLPGRTA